MGSRKCIAHGRGRTLYFFSLFFSFTKVVELTEVVDSSPDGSKRDLGFLSVRVYREHGDGNLVMRREECKADI